MLHTVLLLLADIAIALPAGLSCHLVSSLSRKRVNANYYTSLRQIILMGRDMPLYQNIFCQPRRLPTMRLADSAFHSGILFQLNALMIMSRERQLPAGR